MSITVHLGISTYDDRQLVKTINSWSKTVSCDVYDPTDRINPVILLDNTNIDLANINYMYIPEFGRYYFITNIKGAAGKMVELYGHVDVLNTYASQIKNCNLIAARSTSHPNMYLHDDNRLFETLTYNQYINIGEDLGAPNAAYLVTINDPNPPESSS